VINSASLAAWHTARNNSYSMFVIPPNNRTQAFFVAPRTEIQQEGNWPPLEISWHGQEVRRSPDAIAVDREGRVLVVESDAKITIPRQRSPLIHRSPYHFPCFLIPNKEKLFVLGVNDGVSVYDYNSGKSKSLCWGTSGIGTTDLN